MSSGDNLNEIVLRATIHYYCIHGMHRTMQSSALEGIRMYPGDQNYRFYYGVSLAFEGRIQESIRELESLNTHKDLMLASFLALIYAHRKCQVVDKESVAKLENKLRETRKSTNETGLYYAGLFLVLSGRYDKAKEYVDRMIKMSSTFKEGLILKGWLEVLSCDKEDKSDNLNSAMKYFDNSSKTNDPEVILGKAKVFEKSGVFNSGIEQLNHAIVLYPRFLPAFIEKMKLQAAVKDWDQVVDTAFRCLAIDKHCIEAQRYLTIHSLAWDGCETDAISRLGDLFSSIELRESKNAYVYYETSKLFARLADCNQDVLIQTLALIERAVFLDPTNPLYICEQANQCLHLGRMQDAMRYYKSATQMDEKSIDGLVGMLHCKLVEQEEDVDEQLESVEEFHKTTGLSIELLYLLALSGQRRNKSPSEIQNYLNKIVDLQLEAIKSLPLGVQFYINLNPHFIIAITKLFLEYSPNEPLTHGQAVPEALRQAKDFLFPLVNACPTLKEPLYLMATIKYLIGDDLGAISLMNRCLEHNQSFSEGHVLMAKILEHQGNHQTASKSLEIALSHNFQIREQLPYILTKALVLKRERNYEEALKLLKNALDINKEKSKKRKLNRNDKISLYLQLVDIHSLMGQTNQSGQLLSELLDECRSTPDEGRILIASAQLAQARGEVDQALNVLREITTDHGENFVRSRELMANIYLKIRKDRRLYAGCYREILDKMPTSQSYLMLGDAYMDILEPERAIEIYEQALKKNPKDWFLTRKVGQAYIKTHFYEKAVTYYKAAIKTSGQNTFRFDLAHLLYRMKRFDEAKEIVQNALEISERQDHDIVNLEWECKLINLLAQIQLKNEKKEVAIATLKKAHATHQKLMRRLPVEQPDLVPEYKKLAITTCTQLAELISSHSRDHKQAVQIYKEALNYDDSNIDVLMALAKLEALNNNFELAHNYCTAVLKHAPKMNEPILMMADLTFRQNDFDGAMTHFNELLARKPTYYTAMARFVEIARRVGKLELVPIVLEKAEESSPRALMDSGYHYCKGLYEWFTGNTNEAMKSFNKARQDSQIGVMATYHMIDICINPDNETIGGETFDSSDGSSDLSNYNSSLKTAEGLLMEIRPKVMDDLDFHLMSSFVLLAKRQKNEAEGALNEFMKVLADERYKDNVAAILGVATSFMILKQVPKARNQLKRVSKMQWNFQEAEYLERCWLLLADIYTQTGKYDMAQELLKRCIQYNKSCMKAYEFLGFIMEKEQSYKDAAQNYELAWRFGNRRNPTIGYKLAFNYMKAKRFVDAIDVAKEILTNNPDYPKIKKEILDKCRQQLKM